ncbi:hypothetical protein AVEN_80742-1 [Araneus ventricosus]|uniref:Uncharacterized protein n=1 Tax=Araneus ventricosus TaxID=182803 RepID=A0A4Y2QT26_ARAVE|nr:hypothetical protein AVEN_80742-1 [Araneus ventricosus]
MTRTTHLSKLMPIPPGDVNTIYDSKCNRPSYTAWIFSGIALNLEPSGPNAVRFHLAGHAPWVELASSLQSSGSKAASLPAGYNNHPASSISSWHPQITLSTSAPGF